MAAQFYQSSNLQSEPSPTMKEKPFRNMMSNLNKKVIRTFDKLKASPTPTLTREVSNKSSGMQGEMNSKAGRGGSGVDMTLRRQSSLSFLTATGGTGQSGNVGQMLGYFSSSYSLFVAASVLVAAIAVIMFFLMDL